MADKNQTQPTAEQLAQVDTGARHASGWQGRMILIIAFIWALFQIYISSNIPFFLTELTGLPLVVTSANGRLIHLAFAFVLATMCFPLLKSSPVNRIPWYDWILAALGVLSCLYIVVLRNEIAIRAGLPTTADLAISSIGMIMLGITVYRALGLPLLIVASVFVSYVFFGDANFLPDSVQWKGASFGKAMWHYWMQNEGVFGVALGVSASLIFLFVLFGSILEKSGAGNYFIKVAFALLGHLRGGPAKAAVMASALSGMYSGSSIANTVTTGTFTIPLMKQTGLKAEKAGAVEVASSTNGQLTPPVMGAAAFLIAEFTGISYTDIIKHALVPALISYIALVYIVHLEALKLGLQGLRKPPSSMTFKMKIIGFLGGFIGIGLLGLAVYFGMGWIKAAFPQAAFAIVVMLCAGGYLALLGWAARLPDLKVDPPNEPITELPRAGETAIKGLYFVLPIIILIWCIVIERLSPSFSAFWAMAAITVIALTQHPLKAFFRKTGNFGFEFKKGVAQWKDGMIAGSRNMVAIAIATGAAGIIVGTISLTGAHQVVGDFVEFLSGGNLMIMLLLVAVMSLILGMGLPTTANYIVVSSLMAPVIISLGAQNGLVVPLIAVHLFVFYFGILADDTPPVGLAAFAAAAISKGDPIMTGVQGFAYDIRTALLPFLFIFNTDLLLIDVSPLKAVFVFAIGVIAMMLFASATQMYLLVRNRLWESAALLLVAFTLFRPGYWLDQFQPPYAEVESAKVYQIVDDAPQNGVMTIVVSGPDFDTGELTSTTVLIPLGDLNEAEQRLTSAGLTVVSDNGQMRIEEPFVGTDLFIKIGDLFDYYADQPVVLDHIKQPSERVAKEIFYIPALLVLAGVLLVQRRRKMRLEKLA